MDESCAKDLWNVCIVDGKKHGFILLFTGCLSRNQLQHLGKKGNPDPVALLRGPNGHLLNSTELTNKLAKDPYNEALAKSYNKKMLFSDMLLQLLINQRRSGQVNAEWVGVITSLLKSGRLTRRAFDVFFRLGMSHASSIASEDEHTQLATFYRTTMENLQLELSETLPDSAALRKICVLHIDNYASTQYAAEQTSVKGVAADGVEIVRQIKKFAASTDSLSILVRTFEKHADYKSVNATYDAEHPPPPPACARMMSATDAGKPNHALLDRVF